MSPSERRERGAESDQINITGGNNSPAYYSERYDGGREGGGVEMWADNYCRETRMGML